MTSSLPPDPYAALSIAKDATSSTIKTAYRKLALKNHPDKFPDPVQKAEHAAVFDKIQQAYEILRDNEKRERYNANVRLAELRKEALERQQARGSATKPGLRPAAVNYDTRTPSNTAAYVTRGSSRSCKEPRSWPVYINDDHYDKPHSRQRTTSPPPRRQSTFKIAPVYNDSGSDEHFRYKQWKGKDRVETECQIRKDDEERLRNAALSKRQAQEGAPRDIKPVEHDDVPPKPGENGTSQSETLPRHRRGRSRRNKGRNEESVEEFFSTEILVRDRRGGQHVPAVGRQDSLCAVPLVCSSRWIREMNFEDEITRDFTHPGTKSISGHEMSFQGVVRNMVFTLKGLTFRRDVWICDQLDNLYDFVLGAGFIKENFKVLYQKMFKGVKNVFAGWFAKHKETAEERQEEEVLKAKQEAAAERLEKARRTKQAEERERRRRARMNEAGTL